MTNSCFDYFVRAFRKTEPPFMSLQSTAAWMLRGFSCPWKVKVQMSMLKIIGCAHRCTTQLRKCRLRWRSYFDKQVHDSHFVCNHSIPYQSIAQRYDCYCITCAAGAFSHIEDADAKTPHQLIPKGEGATSELHKWCPAAIGGQELPNGEHYQEPGAFTHGSTNSNAKLQLQNHEGGGAGDSRGARTVNYARLRGTAKRAVATTTRGTGRVGSGGSGVQK